MGRPNPRATLHRWCRSFRWCRGAVGTGRAGQALRPDHTGVTLGTGRASCTLHTLTALGTGCTLRALEVADDVQLPDTLV